MSRITVVLQRELSGEVCQCGSRKFQKQSFCWECYHLLPAALQKPLYKGLSDGYEEAYTAALQFLRGEKFL